MQRQSGGYMIDLTRLQNEFRTGFHLRKSIKFESKPSLTDDTFGSGCGGWRAVHCIGFDTTGMISFLSSTRNQSLFNKSYMTVHSRAIHSDQELPSLTFQGQYDLLGTCLYLLELLELAKCCWTLPNRIDS